MSNIEIPELKDAYKLLHQGILSLSNAEMQGIRIDTGQIQENKKWIEQQSIEEEEKFKSTNFYKEWKKSRDGEEPNHNSNPQLKHFLYKVKEYTPPKYTTKGKQELKEKASSDLGSTDEESLKELGIPAFDHVLRIRKLKKLKDYLDNIEKETVRGYLHPFYNLHTVSSYRSSSSNINAQNIPSHDPEGVELVKGVMYPRLGHQLLEVDYKSLEVAIGACYHKDENMLKYLREGGDMHKDIAEEIFFINNLDQNSEPGKTLRKATKNGFVFPQFYGDYFGNNAKHICQWVGLPRKRFRQGMGMKFDGDLTIADHFRAVRMEDFPKGIRNFEELTEHLEQMQNDLWENRFPDYGQWREDMWEFYQKNGYIDFYTGFRCGGILRKNDTCNYQIQGTAFHVLLKSFIILDQIRQKENWDTKLIGQIHDSILFDVHSDELDHVIETVERVTTKDVPDQWKWIITPLSVEYEITGIDESWANKKELKI